MEFEAKSGSYLLDCCEHTRSFQADEITYMQMMNICLQPYANAVCNMNIHGNDEIKEIILQYRESDWQFFKRLAGKKSTIVYPDNCGKGIQINFGIKETAGFDWYAKGWNTVVDELQPNNTNEVDKISEIINPGGSNASYEERSNNYNELISIIQ